MSDVSPVTDEQRAREAAAKQRFFALSLFRLSGVFILMFGFLIMLQKFSFVSGEKAKIMGAIIACVGLFQTIIIPRLLAHAWRTPPPHPGEHCGGSPPLFYPLRVGRECDGENVGP